MEPKFRIGDVVKWNTVLSGEFSGEITGMGETGSGAWDYEIKCSDGVTRWKYDSHLVLVTAKIPASKGAWRRQA